MEQTTGITGHFQSVASGARNVGFAAGLKSSPTGVWPNSPELVAGAAAVSGFRLPTMRQPAGKIRPRIVVKRALRIESRELDCQV